jgi:hypothetical protein
LTSLGAAAFLAIWHPEHAAWIGAHGGLWRTGLGWLEWGHNVDPTTSAAAGALRRVGASIAARVGSLVPDTAIEAVLKSPLGKPAVAAAFRAIPRQIDTRRAQIADAKRARDRPGADWFHEGYRAPLRGGGA